MENKNKIGFKRVYQYAMNSSYVASMMRPVLLLVEVLAFLLIMKDTEVTVIIIFTLFSYLVIFIVAVTLSYHSIKRNERSN